MRRVNGEGERSRSGKKDQSKPRFKVSGLALGSVLAAYVNIGANVFTRENSTVLKGKESFPCRSMDKCSCGRPLSLPASSSSNKLRRFCTLPRKQSRLKRANEEVPEELRSALESRFSLSYP